jgi:uncharacterized protein YyaL (SSP411 family)
MPNSLITETSPYLLQHAHNPVDWYPWGHEAFKRARKEDKPILASIGYSTCHWCHVMERESFENEAIAHLMNESFICIKVDREERPDVDRVYMDAVQALTGRGGWPLTVFLTPDGEPFFGGTYFPPEDRHGLPGFPRVLKEVAEAYALRRAELASAAKELTSHLRKSFAITPNPVPSTVTTLDRAFKASIIGFDHQNGGFGLAPKFPQPLILEFLLRYHQRTQQLQALQMVELSLDRMAAGGIYDQIGGGFHRYSVDNEWLVPHFEKMLYDNALLSQLYLHAYQATGKDRYRQIVEGTLDYALREMTNASGGFYSAQDADTEGVEGKYYIWTVQEILAVLGADDGRVLKEYFGITEAGNFEGSNVLHIARDMDALASSSGLSLAELEDTLSRCKAKLFTTREQRIKPGCDDKIITWLNGLMLQSLAEAASVLGREDYRKAAVSTAEFIFRELHSDGVLKHSYREGKATIPGYLDDYALLISGLIALHEATFEQRWLESAISIADAMINHFSDKNAEGIFYDTHEDHGDLFVRPRDIFDSVKPCGSSAAADVLLRLGIITGNSVYERRALAALSPMQIQMAADPVAFGNWLCALDFHLSDGKEIVVMGRYNDPDTQALLRTIHSRYIPGKVLVGMDPEQPHTSNVVPLLENRTAIDGHSTAYLCHKHTCELPTSDPHVLQQQLEQP